MGISEDHYYPISEMITDYAAAFKFGEDGTLSLEWKTNAFERISGYLLEDLPKEGLWQSLIAPGDQDSVERHILEIRSGQPSIAEFRILTRSGEFRWLRNHVQPQLDEHGKILRLFITGQDITEQKQVLKAFYESEHRYRTFFDGVRDAILVETPDGKILDANASACDLFGYQRMELIGTKLFQLFQAGSLPSRMLAPGRDLAETPFEAICARKNGTSFPADISVRAQQLGNADVILVVVRDSTERKRDQQLQEAVYRLANSANTAQGLNDFLATAHRILKEVMQAQNFFVALYSQEAGILTFPYYVDEHDAVAPLSTTLVEKTISTFIMRTGSAQLITPEIFNDLVQKGEITLHGPACIDWLGAPLRTSKGEVCGVAVVQTYNPAQRYTERDLNILNFFASQIGSAIERWQAIREREALYKASEVLIKTIELEPLLKNVLHTAIEAIPTAEKGTILLYDEEKEVLSFRAQEGYDHPLLSRIHLSAHQGYAARSLLEKRPLLIADVQRTDPGPIDGLEEAGQIKSAMCVPLLSRGKIIGVISLDNLTHTAAFTQHDLQILITIAAPLASAVENARLFSDAQKKLTEMMTLTQISAALRAARNSTEMLPTTASQITHLINADAVALALIHPYSGETVVEYASGRWQSLQGTRLPPQTGIFGKTFYSGKPILQHPGEEGFVPIQPLKAETSTQSMFCLPLITQELTLGGICVGRDLPIEEEEINLLVAVGNMVANAILRSSLHEETERRLRQLQGLRAIDQAITSSLDLRLTLSILLDQVILQLGVNAADVLLMNPGLQILEFAFGKGLRRSEGEHVRYHLGEGLAGRAAMEQNPTFVSNRTELYADPRRGHWMAEEGFTSYYAVPLIAKGHIKGVLETFQRSPLLPDPEWVQFLESLAGQAAIAIDNAELFERLQRSNDELGLAYDATIEGWARALDLRDRETEGHTRRVTEWATSLARLVGIPESDLVHIWRGAMLHDIGKMGIPDAILLKPGKLTPDEWDIMRRHPDYAADLISPIDFLRPALDIPYCHHEWWDGSGYPQRLKGTSIPLAARIFSIVDVWDALLSDRPYRPAWPEEKVLATLQELSGVQFDPDIVPIFINLLNNRKSLTNFG